MENNEILKAIRAREPTAREIKTREIIIKAIIRTGGIKEIRITDEDREEAEFIY